MFTGYGFFDYKYNIPGYNGQDYDGFGRTLYMIIAIVLTFILPFIFRKAKKEHVEKYLKVFSIAITAFYIIKTTWESYWDISTGRGFNLGLLPLDTCSIVMWASLCAAWGKGKVKEAGEAWLVTGCIVGGLSNYFFLRGLIYYPFFTFGAMYSMIWHLMMVLTGVWMIVTNYVKLDWKLLVKGVIYHAIFSVPAIIYDYIQKDDFMLYREASGVPVISSLAEKLSANNLHFVTTIIMFLTYVALFAIIIYLSLGIKKLLSLIPHKQKLEAETYTANIEDESSKKEG